MKFLETPATKILNLFEILKPGKPSLTDYLCRITSLIERYVDILRYNNNSSFCSIVKYRNTIGASSLESGSYRMYAVYSFQYACAAI